IDKRANNDFNRHNLFTKFEWAPDRDGGFLENFSLGVNDQFFREDRGIPGLGTLTSDVANLSTTRNAVSLEFKKRAIWKRLSLSLIPYLQYQKQQFSDPLGEIGLGIQDNDDDTFQYGSTLLGEWTWGTHQRFTATFDYRGEQFLPEDFSKTPSSGPH